MFDHARRSRSYYERRARRYDLANRVAAFLRGASPSRERRKAVRRLRLEPGHRVLEVSVGTGTNIPFITNRVGTSGSIVGLDISRGMLGVCRRKMQEAGLQGELVEGEAGHLPFPSESFEAILHHGGIAEFGDPGAAISEMYRVARPGGRIVVCDVGVPTDRGMSLVNRLLMVFQPEYNKPPPMEDVPSDAVDARLEWYFNGAWYMISFAKRA